MIKISKRLSTVASLVSEGNTLADVGTDHAYVPIYLIGQKKIPGAIAMDIGKGPLMRAEEDIRRYGMGDYIQTRLSDGVAALSPGEVQSILIAGMGGGLVIHILDMGQQVCRQALELILQPQSELERVREYLEQQGYVTDAEEMVAEDGKYYPMMRVHYEPEYGTPGAACGCGHLFRRYGKQLLEMHSPVLLEYLQKERTVYQEIRKKLKDQEQSPKIMQRLHELEDDLEWNAQALSYYRQMQKTNVP